MALKRDGRDRARPLAWRWTVQDSEVVNSRRLVKWELVSQRSGSATPWRVTSTRF